MRYLGLAAGALAIGGVAVVSNAGCSGSDCAFDQTCVDTSVLLDGGDGGNRADVGADARSDGGTDSGSEVGVDAVHVCDPNADPKDDPTCVVDALGVFVSPQGDDASTGTKAKPFKTIGAAITKAGGKARVFICEGTYDELVKIDAAADGVSLYGGWSCATWAYSGIKGKVSPSAAGIALTVSTTTKAIAVEDLELAAKDAGNAGDSSIAAFLSSSPNVTLRRVRLSAGKGAAGRPGIAGVAGVSTPIDANGTSATGNAGAAEKTCSCTIGATSAGSTKGGLAGAGDTAAPQDGVPGTPTYSPSTPPTATGAGGSALLCAAGTGGNGGRGSDAPAASDGAGAGIVGSIDASGWHPTNGNAGASGTPGQGGGGGAGGKPSGGGGGGACGGCGSGGGGAGNGGGGSIALLALNAPARLIASELVAAAAGAGGSGGAGAAGQAGGARGASFGFACPGGNGGTGGAGGVGGGGAGGSSVGVVFKGTAPTTDAATTVTPGAAGGGGAGGAAAGKGIDGVAQKTLEVP